MDNTVRDRWLTYKYLHMSDQVQFLSWEREACGKEVVLQAVVLDAARFFLQGDHGNVEEAAELLRVDKHEVKVALRHGRSKGWNKLR